MAVIVNLEVAATVNKAPGADRCDDNSSVSSGRSIVRGILRRAAGFVE